MDNSGISRPIRQSLRLSLLSIVKERTKDIIYSLEITTRRKSIFSLPERGNSSLLFSFFSLVACYSSRDTLYKAINWIPVIGATGRGAP